MPNLHGAVTLDLWHTLVYLTPSAEESYMNAQMDLAAEVLDDTPTPPGSARRSRIELRTEFQKVYAGAVAAAQRGVSVPPAAQLTLAAEATGRRAAPDQ